MKYARFLQKQGTIGFVAPSFGCNIEPYRSAFDNAARKWREMGYRLDFGPNCYAGDGIGISSTPQSCGAELTDYYCSGNNDILISCGGGELMCETMEYVDFERIKRAQPKWYMGFSDNTNMTVLLATLCDTASVYGPCASSFGMEPWHQSLFDAYGILTGEIQEVHGYPLWEKEGKKDEMHPFEPYCLTEPKKLRLFFHAGNETVLLRGRLIGGCMDCLVNLLGTRFDQVCAFAERYREDGILWFLESCDLNVMSIRRAVWQMKNAGWFSYVKGFVIGRPLVFGQEMMGLDQYHAVIDLLEEFHVPVIMDADLGHLPPMMPIVCGSMAEVSVERDEIRISYRYL